jgi:cyclic-di-AMP phosphodiesterase PgpH
MRWWFGKSKARRRQLREQRARSVTFGRSLFWSRVLSLHTLTVAAFVVATCSLALIGETTYDYTVGQRIEHPIYASVDFEVPDAEKTAKEREAARANTPSYYTLNSQGLTFDRIRADLRRVYQAAAAAETFEAYAAAMQEMKLTAEPAAYERLRKLVELPGDQGQEQFRNWVDKLPLEEHYVVRNLVQEPRVPPSNTDYILLVREVEGQAETVRIPHADIIHQRDRALRGTAIEIARSFPFELRTTVETVVLNVFSEQPTLLFNRQRTEQAMRESEEAAPVVTTTHLKGRPFIQPGVLGSEAHLLLKAHRAALRDFMAQENPEARQLRRDVMLQRAGLAVLTGALALALMAYTALFHRKLFHSSYAPLGLALLLLGTMAASQFLYARWPDVPAAVFGVCLFTAAVLAIAYEQRFAMGVAGILTLAITVMIRGDVVFVLALGAGVVVLVYELHEIRTRTKLITTGVITGATVAIAVAAGGLYAGWSLDLTGQRTWQSAVAAVGALLLVSGVLPFIERTFSIATALTLLEWRDPTRKLLQLLAREAPGTYNHSLVLGTLAEAACDRIGANGLLAQVGALYHDIGKIPKADYFTENQQGGASRHDKLAPTMSLLIILGHVKDGLEMAREYKLPTILHQFIAEHHGTTVVRYFHHVASEKHAQTATGRHDRELSEAEFRYPGPRPKTRESAVLMLCDGVEGAVRSLSEPTPGRIESMVHQIVTDRLNDGQLSDCDITLREVRLVEESLVKTLCSIYHGRVSYPKARRPKEALGEPARMSV